MADLERKPDLPPPASTVGVLGWAKQNLFSTPVDSLLTLGALYLLYITIVPIVDWGLINADFVGSTRKDCNSGGACWVFVAQRLNFFIYGFYPEAEYWRINFVFGLLAFLIVPQLIENAPYKKFLGWFFLTGFPIVSGVLFVGGIFGLEPVPTDK